MCMAGTESAGNKYIDDFVEMEETFLINRIQIKLKKTPLNCHCEKPSTEEDAVSARWREKGRKEQAVTNLMSFLSKSAETSSAKLSR